MLAVLLLAGMSYALAQTLVVPALPTLAREFSTTQSTSSWLLTGFLLSASVATPIVGKLGDQLGKGRVLTAILLLFATGSTVCAVADSIGVVITGRVIQGVGGGVFPLAFGIRSRPRAPTRSPSSSRPSAGWPRSPQRCRSRRAPARRPPLTPRPARRPVDDQERFGTSAGSRSCSRKKRTIGST